MNMNESFNVANESLIMTNESFIAADNLTKSFDKKQALEQLTFSLPKGEIIGVLGENGVGKSTLLKIIAGLYVPNSGSITVNGVDDPESLRNQMSFLIEPYQLYPKMTSAQLLNYYRDHYTDFDFTMGSGLLAEFEIPLKMQIATLSKGQQEKVCLAMALSRRVSLYIMDEPVAGFDPKFKRDLVKTVLKYLPQDATLLLATHLLRDLDTIFDRVLILKSNEAIVETTEKIREANQSLEEFYLEVI